MVKNKQYYKFCTYGFLKNLRFFDAFFILLLIDKGVTFTNIGIMYALREVIINILEIPSGLIADTYGRKLSLIFSFIFYIFSFIIFYFSQQFWFLLLGFALFGIGDAFRSGTHKAMIIDYLAENNWSNQKVEYYGQTRSCSQKGSALSALFAGGIMFFGSSNIIFLISTIPYLLNIFNVASYPKSLNKSQSYNSKRKLKVTFQDFVNTLKNPKLLGLLNTSATHSAYLKAIKDYVQIIILHLGVSIPLVMNFEGQQRDAILIAVAYFVIFMMSSFASKKAAFIMHIFKKTDIANISLIKGLSFGILSGLFYINGLWFMSLLSFIAIYLIENIRKPILTGFISDNVPNDILTSVISVQSQIKTLLTAIFAVAFGLMMDNYGIGISIIVISSVLMMFTLIFAFWGPKKMG